MRSLTGALEGLCVYSGQRSQNAMARKSVHNDPIISRLCNIWTSWLWSPPGWSYSRTVYTVDDALCYWQLDLSIILHNRQPHDGLGPNTLFCTVWTCSSDVYRMYSLTLVLISIPKGYLDLRAGKCTDRTVWPCSSYMYRTDSLTIE